LAAKGSRLFQHKSGAVVLASEIHWGARLPHWPNIDEKLETNSTIRYNGKQAGEHVILRKGRIWIFGDAAIGVKLWG